MTLGGKLWPSKHSTDGRTGYEVAEAVDFLYGMRTIYDTAERIWVELGAFYYANRLNFDDFVGELRRRIPHTWEDALTDRAKFLYFASKEKGNFPRWYALAEDVKIEIQKRSQYDDRRRDGNVRQSRKDVIDRKQREIKAYDTDLLRRVQRKDELIKELVVNDEVKAKMEMLALQHCAHERDVLADRRHEQREIDFAERDKEEMQRLVEIVEADKHARDEDRQSNSVSKQSFRSVTMMSPT